MAAARNQRTAGMGASWQYFARVKNHGIKHAAPRIVRARHGRSSCGALSENKRGKRGSALGSCSRLARTYVARYALRTALRWRTGASMTAASFASVKKRKNGASIKIENHLGIKATENEEQK